jgi:2-polyprenyl-3-methyl-5-hydroxy-6-metoxy-1,4-benzoquinol methylase
MDWEKENEWERNWWKDCTNTLKEELKQSVYAEKMQINGWPDIDLDGKSILDIGGGPVSLLLKCKNFRGIVVDPCKFPKWVLDRYTAASIIYVPIAAELLTNSARLDEVWIYNVLQHVIDPKQVIENARKAGKIVRVFEWVNAGINPGHPHNLRKETLDKWFNGIGNVESINDRGAIGECYYGLFEGL